MQMKHNKLSLFMGLAILAWLISWSLFPEFFAPYSPKEIFLPWLGVSAQHLLGTNDMGFDIFSELVHASTSTLTIGISAAFFSLVIGTTIGVLSGYLSGWVGELANGFIQVVLMIPMLPMAIVIAAFLGPGSTNIVITIALLGWCSTAKAVRAKTVSLKQTSFVESLKLLDISPFQIMVKHILPNLKDVVLAKYIMSVAACMMLESTLSFIGLGDTINVTWGSMINLAYKRGGFARGAFNWLITPGICITLSILLFYFINNYFEGKSQQVSGVSQSYLE